MKSNTKKLLISASGLPIGPILFVAGMKLNIFLGLPLVVMGVLILGVSVFTTFITAGLMVAEWWESWPKFRYWLERDD